ncbi:MAG TPA: LysR family transcriptional regulator [Noviherbaspirillum sp.]|nr:LysR family transcriptional regulator [Noviherbaspirillum sp.]
MFDSLLLRSFVAVVEEGGFTRAANRLHLTQSAVSGHLRKLEGEIGKPLLLRTTRSMELTPDGEILIGYARAILKLNQDVKGQLVRARYEGIIRIGVSEDFAQAHVLQLLKDFAAQHEETQFYVHVGIPGMLLPALEHGDLDMVIGPQCESRAGGILLWREPLVWAVSAQSTNALPNPVPMAFFPEPCPYREAALVRLTKEGIEQRTAMLCASGASLRAAVVTGFAVTPLPLSQIGDGMRVLEEGLPNLPDVQFMLFVGTTVRHPGVSKLAGALIARCKELAAVSPPQSVS